MKKKLLILAGLGFLMGMAILALISVLFDRASDGTIFFFSGAMLDKVGSRRSATLLSLLVCGLYGAICMGGTLLYEIERWPLALATAVHYLMISALYPIVAAVLCWEMPAKVLLVIEAVMTAGFFLIWLIIYLRYKAQVRELNELLEKGNGEGVPEQREEI